VPPMLRLGPGLALVLVLACSLLPASTALAQRGGGGGGNPLIERGISEHDDLRFEEALQTLSAALVRTGNTRTQQAQIYRYLALTYLALGREEEAAGAWRSMLALDPALEASSDLSPRFRTFFSGVRQQWEDEGRPGQPPPAPVSIQHRSPPQASRGESVDLTAQVEDASARVASLVLAYRQGTSAVFRRVDATRMGPDYLATIPGDDVRPPLVEYYFEAVDANGLPVTSRGDVAAPLRIAVPAPGGDVTEEPWFWIALGGGAAVVVGAIVLGVVLGSQGGGGGTEQGTLVITIND
jgi:tetratricopeptide (TPR) repeat protein